ncbi:DUF4259 domain-containing protein [Streptosporangium sp. NPDC050855]|uniref:DUF4259 domain-containing protein n=1 Tax=Streptosporangium sp. NPDC050855 TaxID=3366194 RepID=UPI00378F41AB
MGTWDLGPFDNDTAADFSGRLDKADEDEREKLIREALARAAGTTDYLDSDDAAEALAAAALVAAQRPGGEAVLSPYGPKKPLPVLPAELGGLAVQALDRVMAEPSELLELWSAEGAGDLWRTSVLRLRNILLADGEGGASS